MDRHEDWINSQQQQVRGAPTRDEIAARKRAMKTERMMIVEKARVEAGKREVGEARKAKKRASRASRDDEVRPNPRLEVLLCCARGAHTQAP